MALANVAKKARKTFGVTLMGSLAKIFPSSSWRTATRTNYCGQRCNQVLGKTLGNLTDQADGTYPEPSHVHRPVFPKVVP